MLAAVLQVPEQPEPGLEQVRRRRIHLPHPDRCLHEQSLHRGVTVRAGLGSDIRPETLLVYCL
ncbi:hypothetical protein [Escherichia phage ZCEC13]|uniref:Uncharacterized protein n=1 Tax=Escherichia phage ZCEC13 TaxID=2935866 RepID=A0AAE9HK36_9CAUD|nr:hypothetical protein [Escherichia phage ZCEC13]